MPIAKAFEAYDRLDIKQKGRITKTTRGSALAVVCAFLTSCGFLFRDNWQGLEVPVVMIANGVVLIFMLVRSGKLSATFFCLFYMFFTCFNACISINFHVSFLGDALSTLMTVLTSELLAVLLIVILVLDLVFRSVSYIFKRSEVGDNKS
ncbi:MAG: hypothetical protein AAF268_08150 [Cyanobacteria bacterium P01_A01_bin.3]